MEDEPKILYKYRDWNNNFHKRLLTNPSIYFAPPSSFEDPLDCKIPTRYDLFTQDEIFGIYVRESIKKNPEFNMQQHLSWAYNWYLHSPMHDPKFIEEIEAETTEDFDQRFGILSLTADPLNFRMWIKYSNRLEGFCVGYKSSKLFDFLGGGGSVEYVKTLPIIKPFEDFESLHAKLVFHKLESWVFEKEYRTHKMWQTKAGHNERNMSIDKDCIINVILGPKMPEIHKKEISELIGRTLPHVQIIETKCEQSKIKFCT